MKTFLLLLFLFNSTLYAVQNEAVSKQNINLTTQEKQWLKNNPLIKIALMSYWEYDSDGNNIHTDVLKLLSKYGKLKIMPVKLNNWKDGFSQASKGKNVHGIMYLSWSKEREKNNFFYTTAYYFKPNYLIVREENSNINSLKDLENRTIFLKEASITHSIIEATDYNIKVIDIDADDKMFEKLSTTKDVSALISYNANKDILEKYNLKIVKTLYDKYSAISIGVSHQHSQLHSIINKIYEIIPTDELMALQNRVYKITNDKQLNLTLKEKQWLTNNPLIKVVLMSFWKYDNNGNNIHTDIIKLLNKYSDLNIIAVKFDTWKEGFTKASSGDYIHGITNLNWSKEREEENFFYTKAYTFKPSYLVIRKDNDTIKSLKDLENKTIYLQSQTITAKIVNDNVKEVKVIEVDSDKELYENLSTSQEAVAFLAFGVNKEKLKKYNLKIAKTIYDRYSDVSIGISHKQPTLNSIINKIYEIIPANELTALQNKKYLNNKIELTTKEREWVDKEPVIKYAYDPNRAPFEYKNSLGQHSGITANILEMISARTGIKFQPIETNSWFESTQAMKNKKSDMLTCIIENNERRTYLDFSKKVLYKVPVVFLTTNNDTTIYEDIAKEFINKKIGFVKGRAISKKMKDKYSDFTYIHLDSIEDGIKQLQNGKIDMLALNLATAKYYIQVLGYNDIHIAIRDKIYFEFKMALQSSLSSNALSILDKALNNISDNDLTDIYNRHTNMLIEEYIDYTIVWQILSVVFIILIIVFYWIRKISKINEKMSLLNDKLQSQQDQLKEETEKAKLASQSKSEFLANMSHEIRTPMNSVIGFTDLLSKMIKDPVQKDYLNSIKVSGRALLTLINDILDLSKIEAGKFKIEKEAIHLQALFKEMNTIFHAKINQKNLIFNLEIDESLPSAIMIDSVRVRQILVNLIGNAIKFTDKGTITLKVENMFKDDIKSKIDLKISVIDTGRGIPKKFQNTVFGAFEQTEKDDATTFGGTGLGLAISSKLTKLMNGTISVTSEVGKGSAFEVLLKDIDVSSLDGEPEIHEIEDATVVFEKAKILIVDDVAENRKLIFATLQDSNLEIIEATNGQEAVELISKRSDIDLVLMDLRMPVMDGYTATVKIREDKQKKDIVIIAFTASVMGKELQKVKEYGFDGYLRKPIDYNDLTNELKKHLSHKIIQNREDSHEDEILPKEIVQNIPNILGLLTTTFKQQLDEVKDKGNFQLIETLMLEIKKLGKNSSLKIVENYADKLLLAIESFDIEKVKSIIGNYDNMCDKLDKAFKDNKDE